MSTTKKEILKKTAKIGEGSDKNQEQDIAATATNVIDSGGVDLEGDIKINVESAGELTRYFVGTLEGNPNQSPAQSPSLSPAPAGRSLGTTHSPSLSPAHSPALSGASGRSSMSSIDSVHFDGTTRRDQSNEAANEAALDRLRSLALGPSMLPQGVGILNFGQDLTSAPASASDLAAPPPADLMAYLKQLALYQASLAQSSSASASMLQTKHSDPLVESKKVAERRRAAAQASLAGAVEGGFEPLLQSSMAMQEKEMYNTSPSPFPGPSSAQEFLTSPLPAESGKKSLVVSNTTPSIPSDGDEDDEKPMIAFSTAAATVSAPATIASSTLPVKSSKKHKKHRKR